MSLNLLKIVNARNLIEYNLEPHPFFNIIYGANGTGKTTILESIYLLLRSRTFRSSNYKSFINHTSVSCTVFSKFSSKLTPQLIDNTKNSFSLGILRSKESNYPILHLNSKKINSISIVSNLVILGLITPDSFSLLDSGPSTRRKFIDWGVFHMKREFITHWRTYKKLFLIGIIY
jgi:DNA replication and repair protein RecF